MSAETVDDDTHEWIPWQFDRRAMIQRAGPPLYAERQAELRRRLRVVQAGAVPAVELEQDDAAYQRVYTQKEMLAGRRAVDRYREGTGPEPTEAQRAAYRAGHRKPGAVRRGLQVTAEIVDAAESGMTLTQIATARGIRPSSVLRRLSKDGRQDVVTRLRATARGVR